AVPRGRRPAPRPRPPEAVRQAWGGGPAARRPDRPCRTGPPPSGPAPIRPGSLTGRSVNHGAEIGNWAGSHHRESDPDGPRPGSHPGRAGAPSRVAWDGDLAQWIRGPGVRPCGPSRAARALWARAAPLPRGDAADPVPDSRRAVSRAARAPGAWAGPRRPRTPRGSGAPIGRAAWRGRVEMALHA